jgi:uncharacterized protein (TIRG00374 family)
MYYTAGEIYFSFLRAKHNVKVNGFFLTRVSLELNFVNHIIPSGGISGLGYLTWRLRKFNVTAGQTTFMQMLRFGTAAVTTANQMWVAIIILSVAGLWQEPALLWISILTAFGLQFLVTVVVLIVKSKKRVDFFSHIASTAINWLVDKLSFGKKRKFLKEDKVDEFFLDLHNDWLIVKKNWKLVLWPFFWATLYSFLEAATYWIVAIALGHWEIFPQIIIGQGIASIVGTILPTPGGVGGYEGAMIAVLIGTGVDPRVSIIVVLVTRVILLGGTILSGWGFYQHALLTKKSYNQENTKN